MTFICLPNTENIKLENQQRFVYIDSMPDGTPFYVGIGKEERLLDPIRNDSHKKICEEHIGCYREIHSIQNSFDDASIVEKYLIKHYGRIDNGTGILCNKTDGGDGGNTLGNRKWFNDGEHEAYFYPGDEPEGWVRGRLKKNCIFNDPEKQKEFSLRADSKKRSEWTKKSWETGNRKQRIYNGHFDGDKNPAKRLDVKEKISKSQKEYWGNPENKRKHREKYNTPEVKEKRKTLSEMKRQYAKETTYTGSLLKITKNIVFEYFNMGPQL